MEDIIDTVRQLPTRLDFAAGLNPIRASIRAALACRPPNAGARIV